MTAPAPPHRLRFRFTKTGKVRFTSHRDVARMWERAFRRVELPLAYTAGFSPRPKVSFGLALPTGYESVAEYLDVELEPDRLAEGFDVAELPGRLTPALPIGIDVIAVEPVAPGADSLQQAVVSSSWELTVAGADDALLRSLVDRALSAPSLVVTRERKGREVTDDVRPAVLSLTVLPGGHGIDAELAAQPRALRPSELLAALEPGLREGLVRRTHQWIPCDGAKREVIPLDATDAPPALERVS